MVRAGVIEHLPCLVGSVYAVNERKKRESKKEEGKMTLIL